MHDITKMSATRTAVTFRLVTLRPFLIPESCVGWNSQDIAITTWDSDLTVIFRVFSKDPLSLNSENAALINYTVHWEKPPSTLKILFDSSPGFSRMFVWTSGAVVVPAESRRSRQELGKDNGPSKGGFLNNRLFSWMIYYLYTHTIGLVTQM